MRFFTFLAASLVFAIVALGIVWAANRMTNTIEKDNAKNDLEVRKIYEKEEKKNE